MHFYELVGPFNKDSGTWGSLILQHRRQLTTEEFMALVEGANTILKDKNPKVNNGIEDIAIYLESYCGFKITSSEVVLYVPTEGEIKPMRIICNKSANS